MPKYISGRIRRTPQDQLSDVRYDYLKLSEAEPNLGDPDLNNTPILPAGEQYIIVSIPGSPGERYWIPKGGGLIPGSITIYEENRLVGGVNSTTQLNFIGDAIKASNNLTFTESTLNFANAATASFNQGIAVTQANNTASGIVKITTDAVGFVTLTNVTGSFNLTDELYYNNNATGITLSSEDSVIDPNVQADIEVSPEFFSLDKQLIFNDNGEFDGAEGLVYFKNLSIEGENVGLASVGVGITQVSQTLHVGGTLKLDSHLYDYVNSNGSIGGLLTRGVNGVIWQPPTAVTSGAGGTYGEMQYHGQAGTVAGADNFVYDVLSSPGRVGIGTTQPRTLLDVQGISTFKGEAFFDDLRTVGSAELYADVKFIGTDSSTRYLLWDKSKNRFRVSTSSSISFGSSDQMHIIFEGGDGKILSDDGDIRIVTNNDGTGTDDIYLQTGPDQTQIFAEANSKVSLAYSGATKLDTQATGVKVSGLTTTDSLHVNGTAGITTILPNSETGTLGTEGQPWSEVWATKVTAEIEGRAALAVTATDSNNIKISNNDTTDYNYYLHFGEDRTSYSFTISEGDVDSINDRITILNHLFKTDDIITFNTVTGDDIIGLSSGTDYTVERLNDDTLQLKDVDDNIIGLSTSGIQGTYTFTVPDRFDKTYISREKLAYNPSGSKLGIGTDVPSYNIDFGLDIAPTIRMVGQDDHTFLRFGAGGDSNDVVLFRVDGNTEGDHVGESDKSEHGFSLKYMGSRDENDNSLSLFSDNQLQTNQIEAISILQDGKIGVNSTSPEYHIDVDGDVRATHFRGTLIGGSDDAVKLQIGEVPSSSTSNIHYLGFVTTSHAHNSRTNESFFSDSLLVFKPDVNRLGIGTNTVDYSLDLGDIDSSTIRLISTETSKSAIRIGVGETPNSATILRIDNEKGETDKSHYGYTFSYVGDDEDSSFVVYTDDKDENNQKEVIRIEQNGSIGIQKSNPDSGYALDITGKVRATNSSGKEFEGDLEGNADTATDLKHTVSSGAGGQILYQSATDDTSFLAAPTDTAKTYVLSFDHSGDAPSWNQTDSFTVENANKVGVTSRADSQDSSHYITFVDSHNETKTNESVYSGKSLVYNPHTETLGTYNVSIGNSLTFGASGSVDSNILPGVDASSETDPKGKDLGSSSKNWRVIYAKKFDGILEGTADDAVILTNARNFSIDGNPNVGNPSFNQVIALSNVTVGVNTNKIHNVNVLGILTGHQPQVRDSSNISYNPLVFDYEIYVTGFEEVDENAGIGTVVLSGFGNTDRTSPDIATFNGNVLNGTKIGFGHYSQAGEVTAAPVAFNGSADVVLEGKLKSNYNIQAGEYGNETTIPKFTINQQGLITDIEQVGVNFQTATVFQSDTVGIGSTDGNHTHYLTFTDSDNSNGRNYEYLYTDFNETEKLSYNPVSGILSTHSISVAGTSFFKGPVGMSTGLEVSGGLKVSGITTLNGGIKSNIIPDTDVTWNLGSPSKRWDNMYVDTVVGNLTGSASDIAVNDNDTDGPQFHLSYSASNGYISPLLHPSGYSYLGPGSYYQFLLVNQPFTTLPSAFDFINPTGPVEVIWSYAGQPQESVRCLASISSNFAYNDQFGQPYYWWYVNLSNTIFLDGGTNGNQSTIVSLLGGAQAGATEQGLLLAKNNAAGVSSTFVTDNLYYNNNTEFLYSEKTKTKILKPEKIEQYATSNSGIANQVIMADGSGGWSWETLSISNSPGVDQGISVYNEDDLPANLVGTQNGIRDLIFSGNNVNLTVHDNNTTKAEINIDDVTVTEVAYNGSNNIFVNNGNAIQVPNTSNAYGKRWIGSSPPTATQGNVGDIWFDTSAADATQIVNQLGQNGAVPLGGIIMWSGTINDISGLTGWRLCDGSQITGSDVTNSPYLNQNTPDLRNRFIVGAGTDTQNLWGFNTDTGAETFSNGQTSVNVGATGGSVAHQLTIAELAAHTHTQNGDYASNGGGTDAGGGSNNPATGSTGGDDYHENRPPYYALAFIMRVV